MFIDKDSLIIDGVNMGTYITEVKYGYHKLWSSKSGRNMEQETVGSFNLFPKLTLYFRKLNKEEMNIISPILNEDTQQVKYYDPELNRKITIPTYTNDWEVACKNMEKGEAFECAFISRKRRVKS